MAAAEAALEVARGECPGRDLVTVVRCDGAARGHAVERTAPTAPGADLASVCGIRGVPAPFPKAFGDGPLATVALQCNRALIALSRTLFAYQVFIEADSTPDVAFVLERARQSDAGATSKRSGT